MADKKTPAKDDTVPDIVRDPTLSTQTQFSSYKPYPGDDLDPDAGPHVIQELGHPTKKK